MADRFCKGTGRDPDVYFTISWASTDIAEITTFIVGALLFSKFGFSSVAWFAAALAAAQIAILAVMLLMPVTGPRESLWSLIFEACTGKERKQVTKESGASNPVHTWKHHTLPARICVCTTFFLAVPFGEPNSVFQLRFKLCCVCCV